MPRPTKRQISRLTCRDCDLEVVRHSPLGDEVSAAVIERGCHVMLEEWGETILFSPTSRRENCANPPA